jgi:hypothetical protein
MEDQKMIRFTNLSNNAPSRPLPYELLVRQSKKLGSVATKAFHDIGRVLLPPIVLPHGGMLDRLRQQVSLVGSSRASEPSADLRKIVKKSHQLLATVRTVFPLTLFPDSVVVDRTKVTIIERDFFWSANTISFQIEDILNVSASVGPFFGSLTIASRVMSTVDHFHVNYLWRKDAIALKHIIQGYIIAKRSGMATDHLSQKELVALLGELGIDSDR